MTSDPAALASRATGPTQPPAIPGVPAQPAGVFNQNITNAQAGSTWAQALNIWTTPWGFLKGAAAAEGATILTHRHNEQVLERLLAGSRTLIGDNLSKVTTRRKDVVQAVGDRDIRKGSNGKVVELHHAPNEHSDGMLVVYLPAEKLLWTADVSIVNPTPLQLGTVKSVAAALDRLKLDYTTWLPAHPPNLDKPLTNADVAKAVGSGGY